MVHIDMSTEKTSEPVTKPHVSPLKLLSENVCWCTVYKFCFATSKELLLYCWKRCLAKSNQV